MTTLQSKAEVSRLCDVSEAAIGKQCKPGGKLHAAMVGTRIDVDHPAAAAYLRGKGAAPPRIRRKAPQSPVEAPADRPSTDEGRPPAPLSYPPSDHGPPSTGKSPEDAREYLRELGKGLRIRDLPGMTLQQLVERFGTATAFKDYLDARKKIEDIVGKELENDETVGRLISRDLVRTHVFGAIEQANKRLLQDAAPNISRTVYALARRGAPVEDAEREARDVIGRILNPVKDQAARALRGQRVGVDQRPGVAGPAVREPDE